MGTESSASEWQDIPEDRVWTPVQVEQLLTRLFNSIARCEIELRRASDDELDATVTYERTHVQTTSDPMCPVVERGGYTVGERDDWVRGVEFEQWQALQEAKARVKRIERYQRRLETQVSLVQTQARMVALAYQSVGT